MKRYNPKDIEPKWQKLWQETQVYKVDFDSKKPKYFGFSMFNYPSGAGIHIGHALTYTISDVKARFKRQQGYESYHPVGWDAFGLPAENYAIKAGVSPQQSMSKIIPSYHSQYQAMGWSNDWSKEISTHTPEYYKWTQWLFIKMHEEGLAYQEAREQWFCEQCQTVLSDAQVIDGKCWRHDGADDPEVKKKDVKQWFFKITDYADELLEATRDLNWTDSVKLAQENWIGKSEGAEIQFKVEGSDEVIEVFTTRADTLHGATFMVLAPEHELVQKITTSEHKKEVDTYVKEAGKKTEVERQANKDKTGVFTGKYAVNPINEEKIPIWIADYVLVGYGTGAIMAVPAHDERDYEFAKKFDLDIKIVNTPGMGVTFSTKKEEVYNEAIKLVTHLHTGPAVYSCNSDFQTGGNFQGRVRGWVIAGDHFNSIKLFSEKHNLEPEFSLDSDENSVLVNSGDFDGQKIDDAKVSIVEQLAKIEAATKKINYKMRDWSVARQRYWGAPIPVVNCVGCFNPETEASVAIDYAHHEGFVWAKEGKKTVLTRLRTEELSSVKPGDTIKFVDNKTSEEVYAKASHVEEFDSVNHLFDNSDYPSKTFKKDFSSVQALKAEYNSNRDGYADQLDNSGIVVIEFSILKKPVVLKEADLPVILPELEDFAPSGDGRSALARAEEWLKVDCPDCGGVAERETDTLDTYVCSSWYMMRYLSPGDDTQPVDPEIAKKWWNVDFYNGADHATAHLLYARFISRFLHKQGYLPDPEPFKNFLFNGKLTAADGTMFSKSKGNGVDPIEIIEQGYGADALRTYLMFAAPLEQWIKWDPQGVPGTYRFLGRLWGLVQEWLENQESAVKNQDTVTQLNKTSHKLAKKVTDDIEASKYNTAIAACMSALNELYKLKDQDFAKSPEWRSALETITMCVAPFAPHIADELWQQLGNTDSVHVDHWPEVDETLLVEDMITIVVQVNGKVRANIEVAAGTGEDEIKEAAQSDDNVAKFIDGKDIKKAIYVDGKLVNFVV